tara:strand:- start:2790 stop:3917 length:1128 start_codon:yes stop_codon:yes gene_type:complete
MRGFLKEIKSTAINRVTGKLSGALGNLSSLTNKLPNGLGGVIQSGFAAAQQNPFQGETIIYPEDLGSQGQGHYIQFFINEQQHANIAFGGGEKIQKQEIPDPDPMGNVGGGGTRTVFKKVPNTINFAEGGDAPVNQRGGSTISVKRAPTKRLNSSICMYMPAQVSVATKADYQDQDIGGIAKILSTLGTTFTSSGSFETALNAAKGDVKQSLQQVAKDALNTFAPGAKALAEIQAGKVFSNRMETVFRGLSKRSFQYQFTMMPKSEAEAQSVRKIVNMFRFYMSPSFEGAANTSRVFVVPATFDIEYRITGKQQENLFLNKISTCVLTSCDVSYGGERTTFFRPTDDGAPPVQTSMTLQFQELELITRERIAAGF